MVEKFDFLLNRKETAEALGVSTQALGGWNIEPVHKPGNNTTRLYYDIREVIQFRLKRDIEAGNVGQSLPHERTRLARAQAETAEVNLKKMKGLLIPADTVTKHWENMFLAFRAKILGIPPRAAMVAINATSVEDVEDSMETFLVEALEELAGDGMPDEYKTVRQDSPESITTTPETISQQVG